MSNRVDTISGTQLQIMTKHYLTKNKEGQVIESPYEACRRVGFTVASAETTEDLRSMWGIEFTNMLADLDFVCNSPGWTGAGRTGQLSACFVIPVPDSMDGIFTAVKAAAMVHKTGGGTGFSFSRLREKDAYIASSGGQSSGPIRFMNVFNAATDVIKQGGTRRGANMGCLRVDHPDIMEFILCKNKAEPCSSCNTPPPFSEFNLSVLITDAFMEAVARGDKSFDLISPATGKSVKSVDPLVLWDLIMHQAWLNGEPGVLFIDTINKANPTPGQGAMEASNPCGEVPLLPWEACNLGSINLVNHLDKNNELNWDKLHATVTKAIRFLDDVVDASKFPLEEITQMVRKNRKLGLGVMGWADYCIKCGISYGSAESIKEATAVMSFIQCTALEASVDLAKERGAFPGVATSIWEKSEKKPRNATRTCIAPTGTTSLVAGVSSGIEPIFGLYYKKTLVDGGELWFLNEDLTKTLLDSGTTEARLAEILDIVRAKDSIQHITDIPVSIRERFRTASEISPEEHVAMQAAFQKYTDNAVSKTVNFSNDATEAYVKKVYELAYKSGLKGITVYRQGSRTTQVLTSASEKTIVTDDISSEITKYLSDLETYQFSVRKRGEELDGKTKRIATGCGKLYVTLNADEYGPAEVFLNHGMSGTCVNAWSQMSAIFLSIGLRSGLDIRRILPKLRNIRCPNPCMTSEGVVLSCPAAIAMTLSKLLTSETDVPVEHTAAYTGYGLCPDCNSPLVADSGCATCPGCGFSRCG